MRFAGPLVLLVLVAAACSSSSSGGSSDGGPDAPTGDATYMPPTPCTCPAGQHLLLFGPPGWCQGSTPTGGASCGTDSCYVLCGDGGTVADAGTDADDDDAPAEAAVDAPAEAAVDAPAEAAPDGATD